MRYKSKIRESSFPRSLICSCRKKSNGKMSARKETPPKRPPPSRPPAPKLKLNRLSSPGLISVHFNAASEEAQDDEESSNSGAVGSPASEAVYFTDVSAHTGQLHSKLPPSQPITPLTTQCAETKAKAETFSIREDGKPSTSILSGIREKFNDPLRGFMGKLEEISSDTVFADIVDRQIKKMDSVDKPNDCDTAPKLDTVSESTASYDEWGTAAETLTANNEQHDSFEIIDGAEEAKHQDNADGANCVKAGKSHDEPTIPMSLSSLLSNDTEDVAFVQPANDLSKQSRGESSNQATIVVTSLRKRHTWFHPRWTSLLIAVVAYFMVPLPPFISGLLLGLTIGVMVMRTYHWLMAPPSKPPFTLPPLASLPSFHIPNRKDKQKDKGGKFKGWMNELVVPYDVNTHHLSETQSVYAQLDSTQLRLQTPRHNVSKRALADHTTHEVSFKKQRFFNILNSKVYLLPDKLVRKRTWSKKYPICIELVEAAIIPLDEKKTGAPERHLVLFARTDREKEEWYRRFVAASHNAPLPTHISQLIAMMEARQDGRFPRCASLNTISPGGGVSNGLRQRHGSTDSDHCSPCNTYTEDRLIAYMRYMSKVMPATVTSRESALCEHNVIWVNALISRLFCDFLREKYWAERIQHKIQKKLSKIHVPHFIDELCVTGIELGTEMPVIRQASPPYLDLRGLWIDVDIAYNGGFCMCLETKVNLMKLSRVSPGMDVTETPNVTTTSTTLNVPRVTPDVDEKSQRSPVSDSDEEDSAESSTDDEVAFETTEVVEDKWSGVASTSSGGGGGNTGRKILRIVNRITQSRYFQHAAENKYIKKAMLGVSNTPLVLNVELRSLIGRLAINIPPPPSDRLWYGFRENPRLWLSAKPRVGTRELNVSKVTDWIEKKLTLEFQRVFVIPNMDDVPVPLMSDSPWTEPTTP